MDAKTTFKLAALLSALSFTIIAMMWLRQGHMDSFWTSLGIDRGGPRLNWCEERVKILHFYDTPLTLTEVDAKWVWKGSEDEPLDYLKIEKWFAKYCQIPLDVDMTVSPRPDQPVAEIQFINGQRMSIYTNGKDGYRIREEIFSSRKFSEALKELMAFGKNIGYQ